MISRSDTWAVRRNKTIVRQYSISVQCTICVRCVYDVYDVYDVCVCVVRAMCVPVESAPAGWTVRPSSLKGQKRTR